MMVRGKQNVKTKSICVIDTCRTPASMLYPVPQKMQKLLKLDGNPGHRICSKHFSSEDFITYNRLKLNPRAVPTFPTGCYTKKIEPKEGCWAVGCNVKAKKRLVKLPSTDVVRKKWISLLELDKNGDVLRGVRICHNHFRRDDWSLVTTKYFRTTAVPRRAIGRTFKKRPRKSKIYVDPSFQTDVIPEHGYAKPIALPRSRTMCFVTGCTARAGNGIKLHKFPLTDKRVCKQWMHAIRRSANPTKYSRVCSRHFLPSDYKPGGNRLKPGAVPSQILPLGSTTHVNVYKLNRGSHKRRSFHYDMDTSSSTSGTSDDLGSSHSNDKGDRQIKEKSGASDNVTRDPRDITDITNPDFDDNLSALDKVCCSSSAMQNDSQTSAGDQSGAHNFSYYHQDTSYIDEHYEQNDSIPHTVGQARDKIRKSEKQVTLTSLIKTDKDACVWTGVASLKQLDAICVSTKALEDQVYQKRFKVHTVDRVILTLSKLKQNISFSALSTLFDISPATASYYFNHTLQVLAKVLRQFIYWPSREEIGYNLPLCFRGSFENVRCIFDCTEISVATLKCINCRISCYSNYKGRRTVKFLLGVTPAGLISFVSEAYSGKASDKQIFNDQNVVSLFDAFRDEIMVDKGFNIENECIAKGIRLHIPPFLRGERHTSADAMLNESIAKARIHVERVIQRVKLFGILQTTIETSMLGIINEIMTVICALVNLSSPILQDDKF